MFKEFSRCSRKGFVLSVMAGGVTILVFAGLSALIGNSNILKVGLIVGLVVSRLAEALFSHSCAWSRVGLEGTVLALTGIALVAADDFVQSIIT